MRFENFWILFLIRNNATQVARAREFWRTLGANTYIYALAHINEVDAYSIIKFIYVRVCFAYNILDGNRNYYISRGVVTKNISLVLPPALLFRDISSRSLVARFA